MAVPTRPIQDAIIDPVWGQWVHDYIATTNRTYKQITAPSGAVAATPLVIPGLDITFTVPAGPSRLVQIEGFANVSKAGTQTAVTQMYIYVAGAQITKSMQTHVGAVYMSHRPGITKSYAPGTYTLSTYLSCGLDSALIQADPDRPAWVAVTVPGVNT